MITTVEEAQSYLNQHGCILTELPDGKIKCTTPWLGEGWSIEGTSVLNLAQELEVHPMGPEGRVRVRPIVHDGNGKEVK